MGFEIADRFKLYDYRIAEHAAAVFDRRFTCFRVRLRRDEPYEQPSVTGYIDDLARTAPANRSVYVLYVIAR